MEGISQRLSVQPLGEDDCVGLALIEVVLNDWRGAGSSINDGAVDFHGARAIWNMFSRYQIRGPAKKRLPSPGVNSRADALTV